jgi:phosphate/sulfate permease
MTVFNAKRKTGVFMIASAVLAAVVASISPSATAQEGSAVSAPIEGSWVFSITRINDVPVSFTAVASFTAGGVFLATGSNDHLNSPGPVSPLYGSWQRTEGNLYLATAQFFAFRPDTGQAVIMLRAVQTFKMTSRNELVGVGEAWACSVQGQDCQRTPIADITITATRIIPEKLTELSLPSE